MILDDLYRRTLNVDEVQRQSIATFISKIVLTFIGFLSTMYFAHMVGSSVLGTYFLFTAYFGIIYIFTDGGLGGAAVKRISEGEEQDEYFTAFVVIRATLTIVIITLILALRPYMDTNPVIFDWLIIALIISSFHCMVSNGIKGRSKMGIAAAGSMTKELT
ncbi:flippase, partial [Methanosalsum natronophilum]